MLDKSYEIVATVKNLTINDSKYYESNTTTANGQQGNLTSNTKTVTRTSNRNIEIKLLGCRTIPVFPLLKTPGIDQGIVAIRLTPHMLLMPVTKEIVTDASTGGVWMSRTP